MVTVKPLTDKNLLSKCATKQLGCPLFCSQGMKIPIYCFGTQYLIDSSLFGGLPHNSEEQSLLDSLHLAQWEERMWTGHFKYDVTASEIKIVRGRRKFLAQLRAVWSMDCLDAENYKMCHKDELLVLDQTRHCEELLFCITNSDKAHSELVPSAVVPSNAILVVINANPIEYGHVFLVPHGFGSLYNVLDARFLEMVARVAVETNNGALRLFCDCPGPTASHMYFQACYFPDLLPVELMPVEILFGEEHQGIQISTIINYPIKTLLFESNCNFKIMVEVLAKTSSFLLDKGIPYNLMISDCGKKVFLFLQVQTLSTSCHLSAWECGGYFLFTSKQEFDQVTEADLLKRLSTVSLDDEEFAAVKQLCCSAASKIATQT